MCSSDSAELDQELEATANEIESELDLDSSIIRTNICHFDQETYDSLFQAGYTLAEIEEVIASKSKSNTETASVSESADVTLNSSFSSVKEPASEKDCAHDVIRKLRIKNVNRIVIGTLNINSLSSKFDQLKAIIGKNIDILLIQETKLDAQRAVCY